MHFHAWTFDNAVGYGRNARSLLRCLDMLGVRYWISSPNVIPDDLKCFERRGAKPDMAMLAPHMDTAAPIQFTMYESTELPSSYVKLLSKRSKIIVPCEQNAMVFRRAGLKNVHVVPLAVVARYVQPAAQRPFTFLHVANDSGVPERKRSKEIVATFCKTFRTEDNVRLVVKKSPTDARITCFDRRVELRYEELPDITPLYISANVGVFLCGQEAWGYSQSELMGLGRPVITPFYGGPADYVDDTCGYSLSYDLVPTPKKTFNKIGKCARASLEDLSSQMRWCYENYDDVVLKGVLAYRRMLGFTHHTMAARLSEALQ